MHTNVFRVSVTRKDIDAPLCEGNPLRVAMRRVIKGQFGLGNTRWFVNEHFAYELPSEAKAFMAAYNRREKVEPFECVLSLGG